MKFADLYPNMKPTDAEEGGMIRGKRAEPCCVCGQPTEYVEICAEAHFCSEECLDEFYTEFWRSVHAMCDAEEEMF